jgi:predicted nucleic acid-binding protein
VSAGIFAFPTSDPLPEILYIDSSVVLEIHYGQRFSAECEQLLQDAADQGSLLVTSAFLFEEVRHRISRAVTMAEAQVRGMNPRLWRPLFESDAAVRSRAMAEIAQVEQLMADHYIFDLGPRVSATTNALALGYMDRYGLLSTDAYHVAVALENQVPDFAAVDADFAAVDGLNFYTCHPDVLANLPLLNTPVPPAPVS